MRRVCLLLLSACLLAQPASAATWYASLTGSNANDGTASDNAHAKRNIRNAVALASAGDSVCIGAGIWTSADDVIDSQLFTVPAGSSTGWASFTHATATPAGAITIGGCGGNNRDNVILRVPNNTQPLRLNSTQAYLIFQDFAIDGINQLDDFDPASTSKPDLIYVSAPVHHVLFRRMDIGRTMSGTIQWSTNGDSDGIYDGYLELLDSRIHHAGAATGDSGHGGAGINNGYGIYAFSSHNTVARNEWYDNYGIAVNIYGDYTTVDSNIIHDNGWQRPTGVYWGIQFCSTAYEHPTTHVAYPCTNGLILNNLIYNNSGEGGGVQLYFGATTTKFYNNTVYGNALQGLHVQGCGSVQIKNNLVQASTSVDYQTDDIGSCTVTCDHNLFDGTASSGCTNTVTIAATFDNVAMELFSLRAGTNSAVDSGTSLTTDVPTDITGATRPSGSGYDMGAYERGATGSIVTITTTLLTNGTKSVAFSSTVMATGGSGTFTACTVTVGSLPTGLSAAISSNNCVVSGTPSAAGTSTFTLRMCDNAGSPVCDTQAFTVQIADVCTSTVSGSWTLVGCPGESSVSGSSTATSYAINSTGADLGVCAVASDLASTSPTLSDSKSNTWTLDRTESALYGRLEIYHARLTSAGSGHTFSVDPGGQHSYPAFICGVFTGSISSPFHADIGGDVTAATSMSAGVLITSRTNELVVQAMDIEINAVTSVALGDSYTLYQRQVTDSSFGIAFGWKTFPAGATNTNPSWTWTGAMDAASVGAAFHSIVTTSIHKPGRMRIRVR